MKRIELTRGAYAIVDDDDYLRLSERSWCLSNHGYAIRTVFRNGKSPIPILMHREIMGLKPKDGLQVDHISCDKLDNRKINLRIATHVQNCCNKGKQRNNTSGFKGVFLFKRTGRFLAQIQFNSKLHYLGFFASAEEASKVYQQAAIRLHGEFARI